MISQKWESQTSFKENYFRTNQKRDFLPQPASFREIVQSIRDKWNYTKSLLLLNKTESLFIEIRLYPRDLSDIELLQFPQVSITGSLSKKDKDSASKHSEGI